MSPLTEPTRLVLAKGQPVPNDPFFYTNTVLLLHGDGINGSTAIKDSSPTPKTVTAVGNAQISTAQSKFGGASIYFDGVNSRATLTGSSTYSMPGDFTVEMWVYQVASGTEKTWFEFGNTNNNEKGILMRNNYIAVGNASPAFANPALANNQWTHLAVARSGTTVVAYKNGAALASITYSLTLTANNGIFLGDSLHSTGRFWNGYINDLRITKDVARYTANFTPPTAPFPDF